MGEYIVLPWRLEIVTDSPRHDHIIEAAAGKGCWASGGGMGERDLSFDFGSEIEAERARRAIIASGVRITYAQVWFCEDNDD